LFPFTWPVSFLSSPVLTLYFRTQLENSENLRIETQNTVETLREEFDSLVKEFQVYKSREAAGKLDEKS
jgi:hypothetical protein